jgi:hypothetical protein
MARYPVYPSTIMSGDLPSQVNMGPWDLYPSSSTGRHYQRRLDSMYGRHLAGAEKPVGSDDEPAYALNELRLMAEMDDVNGNGVFDAPGTRPNIYPDAGIMASSYAIPGYLHRDRMYAPSEVIDANTGRRVTYVNGGMVSMDSTAEIAFIEGGAYARPRPYLDQYSEMNMPGESTVNVAQNPIRVRGGGPPAQNSMPQLLPPPGAENAGAQAGLGDTSPAMKLAITLGLAGLGAGVVYALVRPKHTPNRKRRR